jgi:plastocyanin
VRRVLLRLTKKRNLSLIATAVVFAFVGFMLARQVAIDRRPAQSVDCPVAHCVALKPGNAEPDTLTVIVGESVQFNSADGNKHNLSQGLGGEEHSHTGPYSSGDFAADEAWRVQFKQPGTFKFHDHYDPAINILIVAYEPGNVKPIEL